MASEHDGSSHFRQGSSSSAQGLQYYGALESRPRYLGSTATLGLDEDDESDDDSEQLLDAELARDGLYRGDYRNILLLYTVVPLTALLSFVCLALIPTLAFPTQAPSLFPYPPYLPFRVLEVLTATALWSLSYLLRDFLYAAALFISSSLSSTTPTIITITLSATLQTTSNLLLRQLAIPILLIPYYSSKNYVHGHPTWHDDAFRRVWWVALGWAAAEAVVGVNQGYESIALYKDVLVSVSASNPNTEMGMRRTSEPGESAVDTNKRPETPPQQPGDREDVDATPKQINWENQPWLHGDLASSPTQRTRDSRSLSVGSNLIEGLPPVLNEGQPLLRALIHIPNEGSERLEAENKVERDLEQLIALKTREELEEVYGIPVIYIPVFISCLHRINSILSSLGICLLLTTAYMRSTLAIPISPSFPSPPASSYHSTTFTRIPNLSINPTNLSNRLLTITIPPILTIYILLAIMHTPLVLPRIGIHTFVYIELLVSLGVFFWGLAMWDALS